MSARNADRRTPRSAALRRLIAAGNLLTAAARGEIRATPDLADTWDNAVEALRADLAEPQTRIATVPGSRTILPPVPGCACQRCTS